MDKMRFYLEEYLTALSTSKGVEVMESPDNYVSNAVSKPDPFAVDVQPAARGPVEHSLWDHSDAASDVDTILIPFLTQCCPDLRSFGSVYFPFQSMPLIRTLSSLAKVQTLSLVSADPSNHMGMNEFLPWLENISPKMKTLRFGAEVELDVDSNNLEQEPTLRLAQLSRISNRVVKAISDSSSSSWSLPLQLKRLLIEDWIL